jgi:hypothetical protein
VSVKKLLPFFHLYNQSPAPPQTQPHHPQAAKLFQSGSIFPDTPAAGGGRMLDNEYRMPLIGVCLPSFFGKAGDRTEYQPGIPY